MAFVFLIRMSGQAWEILTAAPSRRLHLTSLLPCYTLTKRVCCGLEENLNVARHWVYILLMCLQHVWAWRVYYFPHWCVLNWKRQQNGIHNPNIYSTSFNFKALWLYSRDFEIKTDSFHPLKIDSDQITDGVWRHNVITDIFTSQIWICIRVNVTREQPGQKHLN